MITLHAATSNPGKLREFVQSASSMDIQVLALPGIAALPEPVEDAPTFAGNADLKAIAYSRSAPDLLVFADDSGLEVRALGGRPGVLSARFADSLNFEPGTTLSPDQRNIRCLLSLFNGRQQANEEQTSRSARFVCALSLARNGNVLLRAEGTIQGELLLTPRGDHGFGYDPLFLVPDRGLTLAELSREEKWAISHRGMAFRDLLQQIAAPQHTLL